MLGPDNPSTVPGQGNLDMSGFKPPRISTADIVPYNLNGEQLTGPSSYVSALEDYLNSTGQEAVFSRGTEDFLTQDTNLNPVNSLTQISAPKTPKIVIDSVPGTNELLPSSKGIAPAVSLNPGQEFTWDDTGKYTGIKDTNATNNDDGLKTSIDEISGNTQYLVESSRSPLANLEFGASQLGDPAVKGLERQNLDYAMSQLGMLTGSSLGNWTDSTTSTPPTPGFDAPYGGATTDGGYTNPFTGTDAAGRTPDDAYYGGLSDYGTAGNDLSYSASNAWTNWGRPLAGILPGSLFTQTFGDAYVGLNPMPGAGNYIPGTDTYIPEYLSNFSGPGDVVADLYGLSEGEQRDMIIDTERMSEGGMFGFDADADPDMQFWENRAEELQFYNDGTPVAEPFSPWTAEAVAVANGYVPIQGSSFGSYEEAQAVANSGFGSDEHIAALEGDDNQEAIDLLNEINDPHGLLSPNPDISPIVTVPENPIVTGLPTIPGTGSDSWTDPDSGLTFHTKNYDWNNDGISDGESSTTTGGTWTDSAGNIWSTEDYANQQELDEDLGFDDTGWGDWGGDNGFGFE